MQGNFKVVPKSIVSGAQRARFYPDPKVAPKQLPPIWQNPLPHVGLFFGKVTSGLFYNGPNVPMKGPPGV